MADIICIPIIFLLLMVTNSLAQNITFVLQEDLPKGTLIGNIFNESKLSESYAIDGITFDFFEINPEHKLLFRLDAVTSNLYTNTSIDRERDGICLYLTNCYFDFKILAHKSDLFKIISTRVNITDLNDNDPYFEKSELVLNLSEATPQFTRVPVPSANDLDKGKDNGVQYYTLTNTGNGASDFRLVEETTNGKLELSISVENGLDRERLDSYLLYLKAVDGGDPVRTGTLTIKVNVLDENDNKPVFKETLVDVNIDETAKAGTLVKQFTATDIDAGKNGEVFYRLKSFQPKEINDSFTIDNSGRLTLAKKLEYEQGKVYTVYIEAVDRGSIPTSAEATVNVHVQDSGNNAPVISVNYLSNQRDGDAVIISEGAEINTLVAIIKVKDTDTGKNGEVSCFTYSTYFGLSVVSATDYTLIVQHKLDRENMESHNVTVTCKDKGQPQMDDSIQFMIILKDENDSPPRFSDYVYRDIKLQENLNIGYHFFTVTATDKDIGNNSKITYEIFPPSDPRFVINPENGEIRTNTIFDRETTSQVVFEVKAKDNGFPTQIESKVSVVVDIIDVNDNAPEFTKMMFDFQIEEGLPIGTTVDSVSAIDKDEGVNREIVFALDPNYNASSLLFTVSQAGEIKTSGDLDREKYSHYNFPVIAADKGSPPLTSTVQVRIKVIDKNDNKPVFIFPKTENNSITVPNTLRDESIIATIQAYDRDYEENGNINFFILSGNTENAFYLNPTTGSLHIKINAIADSRGDKYYKLKIEARDRGSPSHNTSTDLNIVVQHMNVSTLPLTESKEYILISVSIVCVTFVCAVGLIAVICFLRKKNIACGKSDQYVDSRPPQYDQVQPGSNNYPYSIQNEKNKQRVKFSEPGTTFTKQQMMDNLTLTKKDSPRKEKDDNNYNFDRQMKPPEESETSSKTDSGHGSEEDFHHPIDKPARQFSMNSQTVPAYNNSSGIYVMLDRNKPNNTDIPRSNVLERLPSNKYLDDSCLTASLNSMWSEANPSSSRHPSHSQTSSHNPTWTHDLKLNFQNNTPFYMALGSIQSRDDDGSTTTSGSYTINPDELDDDFSNHPKDLFV